MDTWLLKLFGIALVNSLNIVIFNYCCMQLVNRPDIDLFSFLVAAVVKGVTEQGLLMFLVFPYKFSKVMANFIVVILESLINR